MSIKKAIYRAVRYNSWAEQFQNAIRKTRLMEFPEIGLVVEVGTGDVIIDCGANVGVITSKAARTGATVYAFEPQPVCFDIIRKRFARIPNVVCLNQGVMDKPCSLTLSTPVAHAQYDRIDTTVSASFFAASAVEVDSVEVECIDLAKFILALDRPVRLLKMDIEAAEIPVLNHLIDTGAIDRVDLALVETHQRFSPEIAEATEALRSRISQLGLSEKIRLDWI